MSSTKASTRLDWTTHLGPERTLAVDVAGGRSPAGPPHYLALKTTKDLRGFVLDWTPPALEARENTAEIAPLDFARRPRLGAWTLRRRDAARAPGRYARATP